MDPEFEVLTESDIIAESDTKPAPPPDDIDDEAPTLEWVIPAEILEKARAFG